MLEIDLNAQALRYLNQVLGPEAVRATGKPPLDGLPYFLGESYDLVAAELHGKAILLACVRHPQALPARQMERQVHLMRERLQVPVIVALPHVTPGTRKQLILHRLAFVVPGSQLYAPELGMVLSEQFAAPARRAKELLSPATQTMLIGFLLRHPAAQRWQPSADAVAMGYTAMTATRAVRELLQHQLFGLEVHGRAKHLKMVMTHRQLWDKVQPHLSSPVQRTLWTYDPRILQMPDVRVAGLSALARRSMLDEPPAPVVAMTAASAAQARSEGVFFEPHPVADAIEVQIWRETPTMDSAPDAVDPLSLLLSLREHQDPRVQMALHDVDKALPW